MSPTSFLKTLLLSVTTISFAANLTAVTYAQTSENINVKAFVPAQTTDFQIELVSRTPKNPVPQDTMDSYEITYGASLPTPTTLTIEAEWTLGTLAGDAVPSINLLGYVTGSAKNAYSNTPPVIDLANRKITWTINSFPVNTNDQKVFFSLKTPEDYTIDKNVSYKIKARVSALGGSSTDQEIHKNYRYATAPTPTIPQPTRVQLSGIPTKEDPSLSVETVSIDTIATTSAGVVVSLSKPAGLTLQYGTSPTSLNNRITALEKLAIHRINLSPLSKATKYYFRIQTAAAEGKNVSSDLFTFTTANAQTTTAVEEDTLLISSNATILHHPSAGSENDIIIVPNQMPFLVQFRVSDPSSVKAVQLFLRNTQVLGITNFTAEAASNNTESPMQTTKPGLYTGRLTARVPSLYDLYVRLFDHRGNITEKKLMHVKITPLMRVIEEHTTRPIEHAKVSLSVYNAQTKLYESLVQTVAGIPNPIHTDQNGVVQIVLPANRYRAEVSGLGYVNKLVDFTLGASANETYPSIELAKKPFSVVTSAELIRDVFIESAILSKESAKQFAFSYRFFTLAATIIVTCFVILTLIAFTARTHIPLQNIPAYILHHFQTARCAISEVIPVTGSIHDERMMRPVPTARVLLLDAATGDLITQVVSNKQGRFRLKVRSGCNYDIAVSAVGYPMYRQDVINPSEPLHISLTGKPRVQIHHIIIETVGQIFSFFFEVLLFASFLLEIMLGFGRGWLEALPFLAMSILNLGLWVFYLKHDK